MYYQRRLTAQTHVRSYKTGFQNKNKIPERYTG